MHESSKNHFYLNRQTQLENQQEKVWNNDQSESMAMGMVEVLCMETIEATKIWKGEEMKWETLEMSQIEISWCIRGICLRRRIRNFILFRARIWTKVFEEFVCRWDKKEIKMIILNNYTNLLNNHFPFFFIFRYYLADLSS